MIVGATFIRPKTKLFSSWRIQTNNMPYNSTVWLSSVKKNTDGSLDIYVQHESGKRQTVQLASVSSTPFYPGRGKFSYVWFTVNKCKASSSIK
jgi:hypothetical protein